MFKKHMAFERRRFWRESFQKFLSFSNLSDGESRTNVTVLLDQLNSEEYYENFTTDHSEVVQFINAGCRLIPVDKTNSSLLSKFFQLAQRILARQKVIFDEKSLSNLLQHVISSARHCPSISVYDNLRLLQELLFENGAKSQKFYSELLGNKPLGLLLECCKSADIKTQKAAVICIGNLCVKDANGSIIAENYGEIGLLAILNVLQSPPRKDTIKIEHCKLINVSLRAVQNILPCIKYLLKHHLGQILLTIKNYIFYGFPDYEPSFPNFVVSDSSSPLDSSSDLEPDDISLLKVSLNPVKERAFPAREALKKKYRQKRGKRQKNEESSEQMEASSNFSRAGIHARTPRTRVSRETRSERDTLTPAGTADQSWRDREPNWRLDDSMNSKQSSSESDFSDNESGQMRRLKSATARVRNTSLVSLQVVIKNSEKKDLFGFWSSFISDGNGALTWSLLTIIQNDSNIKNRIGATSVLMDLLDGCKPFLAAADDSDHNQTSFCRPFMSFSSRLGSMVHELHRLLEFIPTEASRTAQSQLVKCLAMLVLNCPYQKLQHGLLTRVVQTIRPILKDNDMSLKQSCLVCLSAVLTVNAPMTEVVDLIEETRPFHAQSLGTSSTHPATSSEVPIKTSAHFATSSGHAVRTAAESKSSDTFSNTTTTTSEELPWLICECFTILKQTAGLLEGDTFNDDLATLRSEALLLLIVYVRNYFTQLRLVVHHVSSVARECLQDCSSTIKVNAIKVLQEIGRVMYVAFYHNNEEGLRAQIREFWFKILQGEIVKILQSKDPLESKSKSAACDCLSDIGAGVFEELTFDKRILIVTMLLGLANDEDSHVRAASIRALGLYILYPALREDNVFVTDTANVALRGLNDSILLVRMRGAWALANLSDALVINKNSENSTFIHEFSETLLLRLINTSVESSDDSEKVRCNIVRTLGNLAKYISESDIEKQTFVVAVEKIFEVLSKCILNGQMKTRWNACYAAGNVFSNPTLPNGRTPAAIQMLDALLLVVDSCKNFKVRINAVNALAVPSSRGCYGDEKQFVKVWCCLCETLAGAESISDFSEFKYRENLKQQICITICHITTLLHLSDLKHITPTVQLHHEYLTEELTNVYQKQLKQSKELSDQNNGTGQTDLSSEPFLLAYNHILTLLEGADVIQNIFIEARSGAEDAIKKAMGM